MINVTVKYTVTPDFSDANRENIETFLEAFRELDHTKFRYQVFVEEDGCTFRHVSAYADEDIQNQLLAVPAFVEFQKHRDQNLQREPEIKTLKFQGSAGSFDHVFDNFDAPNP